MFARNVSIHSKYNSKPRRLLTREVRCTRPTLVCVEIKATSRIPEVVQSNRLLETRL
jgi:hypothetical protein